MARIPRGHRAAVTQFCRLSLKWAGLWTDGRDDFIEGTGRHAPAGEYRAIATRANGQPAVAVYLRRPGDERFRRLALEVLATDGDAITEIVDFSDPRLLEAFGLPDAL